MLHSIGSVMSKASVVFKWLMPSQMMPGPAESERSCTCLRFLDHAKRVGQRWSM